MNLRPIRLRAGAGRTRAQPLGTGFDALFWGSLITNSGDGIRLAALPLLAASLTSSPLLISAVTAAQYLPWATFAPLGGVIVDRRDRRQTILVTQTWRGLLMAALATSVWMDLAAIWQLCVVAFLVTVGEIMVDPSIVALVPTVVDDADLDPGERSHRQRSDEERKPRSEEGHPVPRRRTASVEPVRPLTASRSHERAVPDAGSPAP